MGERGNDNPVSSVEVPVCPQHNIYIGAYLQARQFSIERAQHLLLAIHIFIGL